MLPRCSGLGRKGRGCQPVHGAMRSLVVVRFSPGDHPPTGLLACGPQPSGEAPLAKHPVDARVRPALPWAARFNAGGGTRVGPPPVRALWRAELRAIVPSHLARRAALGEQPLEPPDDLPRRDRPGAVKRQPFPGVRIQHRQAFQPPPLGGRVVDNVVAPDLGGRRCPGRHSWVRPDGAPLARVLAHWHSLALPQAADRVATHGPRFGLQQGEHLALPQAGLALRAAMKTGDHRRPLRLPWLPTLGPASQGQHPAGTPCAHPVRLLRRSRGTALGRQAHHVFPRPSFSLRLARVRSPPRRFRAAFSRSRARSGLASERSIPPHWRRHRYRVCSALLYGRQTARTFPSASASRKRRIICSAETRWRFLLPPVARAGNPGLQTSHSDWTQYQGAGHSGPSLWSAKPSPSPRSMFVNAPKQCPSWF
jgi:hypothetical protein